jgi:hypothetical protein
VAGLIDSDTVPEPTLSPSIQRFAMSFMGRKLVAGIGEVMRTLSARLPTIRA